ncbi:hypothetical protein JANAI62_21670 [Jannaschia pagri]|uniref:Helix-turn-helix domain-containing protein n=1 Tax=Jannaschia pagri TaxID=2829797 RepID=A0ABQ4NMA3_9RHOB|nr:MULTISPECIES: hypothetical protein [unclassified Jannaschia]GIT91710.1 hypothetical protein JANAI61_21680 [Jannaschia sp. AI_61]GIT95544.1 hypothetical protein JANAI62_21670 [Jannaschia sp. AI_62]
MSWRLANACAERKFGSATRKQIIMFLADKASDDGSGIWCSKGTIQRHTELGETTVKRTIRHFLKEGILVETGARGCKNGFTVVYRIDLARIEALELTAEPDIETGATVDPLQTGPGTGATVAGVPGPPRPPNHPKTTHKPPTREREAVEDEEAKKLLAAYPPDRLRGKAECLGQIRDILDAGTEVEDLVQAVKAYATESAGFTRSKVCFSDNWFKSGRWRAYVEGIAKGREETKAKEAEMLAGLANWVTDRHPLCRHITPGQIDALLASELVTQAQIQAAGLGS